MKLTQINRAEADEFALAGFPPSVGSIQVEVGNALVTVSEGAGQPSVSIEPLGREFIDAVELSSAHFNRSQVFIRFRGVTSPGLAEAIERKGRR